MAVRVFKGQREQKKKKKNVIPNDFGAKGHRHSETVLAKMWYT